MKGWEIIVVLAGGVLLLASTSKAAQVAAQTPATPYAPNTAADYQTSLGIDGPIPAGNPNSVPPL